MNLLSFLLLPSLFYITLASNSTLKCATCSFTPTGTTTCSLSCPASNYFVINKAYASSYMNQLTTNVIDVTPYFLLTNSVGLCNTVLSGSCPVSIINAGFYTPPVNPQPYTLDTALNYGVVIAYSCFDPDNSTVSSRIQTVASIITNTVLSAVGTPMLTSTNLNSLLNAKLQELIVNSLSVTVPSFVLDVQTSLIPLSQIMAAQNYATCVIQQGSTNTNTCSLSCNSNQKLQIFQALTTPYIGQSSATLTDITSNFANCNFASSCSNSLNANTNFYTTNNLASNVDYIAIVGYKCASFFVPTSAPTIAPTVALNLSPTNSPTNKPTSFVDVSSDNKNTIVVFTFLGVFVTLILYTLTLFWCKTIQPTPQQKHLVQL